MASFHECGFFPVFSDRPNRAHDGGFTFPALGLLKGSEMAVLVFPRRVRDLLVNRNFVPRSLGLTDQIFFSISSLIQTFAYARLLSPSDFGYYSVVVSLCVFLQSVQRAILILPMIVSIRASQKKIGREWILISRIILAVCLLLGLIAAFTIWITHYNSNQWKTCLVVSFAVCSYLWYDFTRRCFFLVGHFARAASSSSIYLLSNFAGVVVAYLLGANFLIVTLAFAFSTLIAAGIARLIVVHFEEEASRSLRDVINEFGRVAGWNLAALAPYAIYTSAMPAILALLAGPAAAGGFAATRVVISPITMLVSAIDNTDKPRASRAFVSGGTEALAASLLATFRSLLTVGLPYLLVIIVVPGMALHVLLGSKYIGQSNVGQMWAVVGFFMLMAQPVEAGLVVLRRSDSYFWSRLTAALVLIVALQVDWTANMTLRGTGAVASAWLTSDILAVLIILKIFRRKRGPDPNG